MNSPDISAFHRLLGRVVHPLRRISIRAKVMLVPAAAIVVLLPIYLAQLGLDLRDSPLLLNLVLAYTMVIGVMMVSNIPTYSGKLLGERIGREWVLPIFILVMLALACLVTYPYATLAIASLVYLGFIPWTLQRYRRLERLHAPPPPVTPAQASTPSTEADKADMASTTDAPDASPSEPSRVIEIRPSEQKR